MPFEREQLEEFAAAARDVARVAKAQFDALVEAGFPHAEALNIVQVWFFAEMDRRRVENELNSE